MSEKQINPNPMPEIHLFPRLERIGKAVGGLFCKHQLATHGDHFVHPLDEVFDKPPYTQEQLFNAELSGWGIDVGE